MTGSIVYNNVTQRQNVYCCFDSIVESHRFDLVQLVFALGVNAYHFNGNTFSR